VDPGHGKHPSHFVNLHPLGALLEMGHSDLENIGQSDLINIFGKGCHPGSVSQFFRIFSTLEILNFPFLKIQVLNKCGTLFYSFLIFKSLKIGIY
jgi:hypothetical protein